MKIKKTKMATNKNSKGNVASYKGLAGGNFFNGFTQNGAAIYYEARKQQKLYNNNAPHEKLVIKEVKPNEYPKEIKEKILNLKEGHKIAWTATDGSEMVTIAPAVEKNTIGKTSKKVLINFKRIKQKG